MSGLGVGKGGRTERRTVKEASKQASKQPTKEGSRVVGGDCIGRGGGASRHVSDV